MTKLTVSTVHAATPRQQEMIREHVDKENAHIIRKFEDEKYQLTETGKEWIDANSSRRRQA